MVWGNVCFPYAPKGEMQDVSRISKQWFSLSGLWSSRVLYAVFFILFLGSKTTYMYKLIITLLCAALAGTTSAQSQAKIYKNCFEYRNNKAISHEVVVEQRSPKELKKQGGAYYKIYSTTDAVLSDNLLKYYQLVAIGDTMFVNCVMINSMGYGVGFYKSAEYLFFTGPATSNDGGTVTAGILGGAIGAAAYGAAHQGSGYNYAIDLRTEKVYPVDRGFMKDLLGKKTELYKSYNNEEYMYDTDVVLKYLRKHAKKKN